jgi:hypothetical protein
MAAADSLAQRRMPWRIKNASLNHIPLSLPLPHTTLSSRIRSNCSIQRRATRLEARHRDHQSPSPKCQHRRPGNTSSLQVPSTTRLCTGQIQSWLPPPRSHQRSTGWTSRSEQAMLAIQSTFAHPTCPPSTPFPTRCKHTTHSTAPLAPFLNQVRCRASHWATRECRTCPRTPSTSTSTSSTWMDPLSWQICPLLCWMGRR